MIILGGTFQNHQFLPKILSLIHYMNLSQHCETGDFLNINFNLNLHDKSQISPIINFYDSPTPKTG